MERKIKNIVILGSGNVATHLALALISKGYNIEQIFSRNLQNAQNLAHKVNATYINNLNALFPNADLYMLSVKDDALKKLVSASELRHKPMVHTAGSISSDIFKAYTQNFGVLYPFQTFSKERSVDFNKVPILVEASTDEFQASLTDLANALSEKVINAGSKERSMLHISAVFACNFTNHMYAIAYDLAQKNNIPFDLLKPLIKETAEKVSDLAPRDAQTGPAVRFDQAILEQHENFLQDVPELAELYKKISTSIQKFKA